MSSDLVHEAVPPLAWDHQGLPFQPPPETIAWKVREYTGKPGRPGIVWDGTGPMHVELETTMQDFRKMVEPELKNHVVGLLLNLARTIDEGVQALHAEDMALWKQALTGVGMIMDKVGKEAAKNTAAFREVVVELPEIAKKGLNTAGIALIAAGVLGAAFVVPPVIRAMRKD